MLVTGDKQLVKMMEQFHFKNMDQHQLRNVKLKDK